MVSSRKNKTFFKTTLILTVIVIFLISLGFGMRQVSEPKETKESEAAESDARLYIGTGGEVATYNLVRKSWSKTGKLENATIFSLAVYKGKVYAGFSNGVVRAFTPGVGWVNLGDQGGSVNAMEIYNDRLYVGLSFENEQTPVLKSFDGVTWRAEGRETLRKSVIKLKVFSPNVSGAITSPKLFIASTNCYNYYDSKTGFWSSEYCPAAYNTGAMETYDNKLWLGDAGVRGNIITTTTGKDLTVQPNLGMGVRAMEVFKDKLYVSGWSSSSGGTVFVFMNGEWINLGSQGSPEIKSMVVSPFDSKMYVAETGPSGKIGGISSYNGSSWEYISAPTNWPSFSPTAMVYYSP